VTDETVAENGALAEPAAIVTPAGTTTLAPLSERETGNPPAGAGPLIVTVQLELPGAVKFAGEQLKPLRVTVMVRAMVSVRVWPPKLAVTVAVWLLLIAPAVAEKLTLVEPALIVTLPGTPRAPTLLEIEMLAVLVAALLSETVQVEVWPEPSVGGLQLRLDS
jgi:hypothetical protein